MKLPVNVPVAVGVNATVNVIEPPGGRVFGRAGRFRSENGGAAIALGALLDHVGTDFDVHGFFTTGPLTLPDLVITGMIPSLGMDGTGGGTLLQAEVIDLELFGDAGTGAYALNGYFRVMGGELVTEGYLQEDDVVGMASWLTTVRPPLPEGFDFTSDFATVTHLGEFGEVPEPATLSLAAVACGAFAVIRRRRRA